MSTEPLEIVYPDRYTTCGECAVAVALASKISTSSIREIAARNGMALNSRLQIHCVDWINSTTPVPNPKRQTVIQAQIRDDARSLIGITDGEVVECPGKTSGLPPQKRQLSR